MGHTPYGYRIENGCAVINEDEAAKIRNLYENYIAGMAQSKADFYPAIIDQETFDKAESIRLERAGKLGRLNLLKSSKPIEVPTHFRFAEADEEYEDPRLQAEYLYSLIESEAI